MTKSFLWIKAFLAVFTIASFGAHSRELFNNLSGFDGSIQSYTRYRPKLWGDAHLPVFVRRDLVKVRPGLEVKASFLSDDSPSLEAKNFSNLGGENLPLGPPTKFSFDWDSLATGGLNVANATAMSEIASTIYLNFPDAAERFSKMGFTNQSYIAGIHKDSQGVILENDDSIIIAFRGSEVKKLKDWLVDADLFSVPAFGHTPRVHLGFYKASSELWPFVREVIPSTIENKLRALVNSMSVEERNKYGIKSRVSAPSNKKIFLTGHSMGAAVATLLFAELTLQLKENMENDYYFVDPVLKSLGDQKINQIISDTLSGSINVENPFSIPEEDAFGFANTLKHYPVLENDGEGLVDARLKGLITFGSPRVGDWIFKYAVERYAVAAGAEVLRFENSYIDGTITSPSYFGDIVTRVPLNLPRFLSQEYSHVGVRVYFKSSEDELLGDPTKIVCEYTNETTESTFHDLHLESLLENASEAFGLAHFHRMRLYTSRIRSYFTSGKATPVFPAGHNCSNLSFKFAQTH